MSRRKGFSLVELLIVLAVIAALIATITPVALNAIQKAKATQVAQNLKTLASAFENKAYVDGATQAEAIADLTKISRDVTGDYKLFYKHSNGTFTCVVVFTPTNAVNEDKVIEALQNARTDRLYTDSDFNWITKGGKSTTATSIDENLGVYYPFVFSVY